VAATYELGAEAREFALLPAGVALEQGFCDDEAEYGVS
jgi:hypothetical protein